MYTLFLSSIEFFAGGLVGFRLALWIGFCVPFQMIFFEATLNSPQPL